jgi:hypothetical protein
MSDYLGTTEFEHSKLAHFLTYEPVGDYQGEHHITLSIVPFYEQEGTLHCFCPSQMGIPCVVGVQEFVSHTAEFAISGIPLTLQQRKTLEEQRCDHPNLLMGRAGCRPIGAQFPGNTFL